MTKRSSAKRGQPSDPQERGGSGHDGQLQPEEAKPPAAPEILVSTVDDPADRDPLAGAPLAQGDAVGFTSDADERLLKPVLTRKNNRTGGG